MGRVKPLRRFRYKNAVPQEKDLSAYLMVFHKDETHGLYMALSRDGYTFTALNDGEPVLAGDTIAYQRGIRDPYIYRGPDGAFYLAMTDLHVFAVATATAKRSGSATVTCTVGETIRGLC